ncbi:MAG: GFA family protein [Acidobacteriota bacterium]
MSYPIEGGCDCRAVRYRMHSAPLIVHCCHCRWCQRETGASFALNALIEADRVELLGQTPEMIATPSASGKGQKIHRCPTCKLAVWSNYPGGGDLVRFIRVGTLDNPDVCPPDVHIYTSTKQPWLVLPPGARAFAEFYDLPATWSPESLARRRAMRERAGLPV